MGDRMFVDTNILMYASIADQYDGVLSDGGSVAKIYAAHFYAGLAFGLVFAWSMRSPAVASRF